MRTIFVRFFKALNFYSLRALDKLNTPRENGLAVELSRTANRAAVVITTYSGRLFQYALPTIQTLRASGLENEIFLVINGDQNSRYDQSIRHEFLKELLSAHFVNPVCMGTGRGMSELWNFGARTAGCEKIIFLGDDLTLQEASAADAIYAIEDSLESNHLVILNESFGHFGTTRTALTKVGWFDERFLGFGEEDGDYYWRIREDFGSESISWIAHHGINNISSGVGFDEEVVSNDGNKYSLFNRAFLRHKYSFDEKDNRTGFLAHPILKLDRESRYSDERFRDVHADLTTEINFDKIRHELEIRQNMDAV